MEFDFPTKKFVGISRLIAHVSRECQELILCIITFNSDNWTSASQIINHAYFADLNELDDNKKRGVVISKWILSDNLS